jgi:hypothetical protein
MDMVPLMIFVPKSKFDVDDGVFNTAQFNVEIVSVPCAVG